MLHVSHTGGGQLRVKVVLLLSFIRFRGKYGPTPPEIPLNLMFVLDFHVAARKVCIWKRIVASTRFRVNQGIDDSMIATLLRVENHQRRGQHPRDDMARGR